MRGKPYSYHLVPEIQSGYILDPQNGYFSVVVPEYGINYVGNPSAEILDSGYFVLLGSTIVRTNAKACRGLWSMKCTPGANLRSGIQYVGSSLASTDPRVISVDVWAEAGEKLVLSGRIGAGTEIILKHYVGQARWQRIWGILPGGGGIPTIIVRKDDTFSHTPFYIDGLQEELGTHVTTYIDGDQVGYKPGLLDYYWLGIPHMSSSVRAPNCRSGGREYNLKDLGFEVMAITGLGMATVNPDIMEFGTLDGGEYHDSHTPPRQFTITGAMFGRRKGDLARDRVSLMNTIKPDIVVPKQPVVLRYRFNDGCEQVGKVLEIPAVYIEGMGGQFDNHHQERIALTFTAPYPYMLEDGDGQKFLDDIDSFAADAWALRDTESEWHNYGNASYLGGAASIFEIIQSRYYGGLFLAGQFDTVNGLPCEGLAFLSLDSRIWTMYTPWADDTIRVLHEDSIGNLYMGGDFHNIGLNAHNHVCYMDTGGNDVAIAGGADDIVKAITVTYNGDIYIGGEFLNVGTGGGSVAASYLAMYDVSAATWVNITPLGDSNGHVTRLLLGTDQKIYVAGDFTTINGIAAVNHVAVYDPATQTWDNLGAGFTGGNVYDLAFGPDGRLYAVGDFTGPCLCAAVFNGANWEPLGGGVQITSTGAADTTIFKIRPAPDGKLWMAGDFAIPGPFVNYDVEYASWNGTNFGILDALPPTQADFAACDGLTICPTNANEIAVSFDYSTAVPGNRMYFGQVMDLNNVGSSIAHPTLVGHISGGVYYTLYIRNVDTGDELLLDIQMEDEGRFWVSMTPGNIRSYSTFRNVEQCLFDGSNLATFKLKPGLNRISVYGKRTSTTNEFGFYWRNNYWGADDGVL